MYPLRVGAGKACIDPPASEYPFPSTFGMMDEIRDSCYVRSIAIDNGEKKVLFVIYELADLPRVPDLEEKLGALWGIGKEDVILCVSHNHSSPSDRCKFPCDEKKLELFLEIELEKGLEAVRQAVDSLRPAKWGYGEIESYCNVNRDLKTRFGFWVEGPAYTAYSNHTLACVKFVDENDKVIAALLNFGAHAVCAFVQKDVDGKIKSSSNFPGIACRFVEEYYGDDCIVAWTSGAAGNQDPLLFDYQWLEYPDGYDMSGRNAAALFLLTADEGLWQRVLWHFDNSGFDFPAIRLSGIHPELYSIYQAAKTISVGLQKKYLKWTK